MAGTIRGTIIFLLAIALGALTVSGQDAGRDADLRRRIRALSEELKQRADGRAEQRGAAARPVLRIHEVGDLLTIQTVGVGELVDLIPSRYQPAAAREFEPSAPFSVDFLIELMRQVIEPESWEEIEGAEVQPRNGRLFVNQIPRVQRKIAALLDSLRVAADRQLRVRFVAVPVNAADLALLDARPRELSSAEAEQLLAREPLGVAETVCRSGQRLSERIGRRISYLQDYDVEIAQEATIGDPIRMEAFSGMAVELQPLLDDGGGGVRLDFQVTRTELAEPIRRVDTEHGPLELPVLAMTRVQGAAWVPLGKTSIVGGSTSGANPCLFLVTVHRMGAE